jgi:hypothetical protein
VTTGAKKNKNRSTIVQAEGDVYDVVDDYDLQYFLTLYCGSEFGEMEVTLDTGSDWLILQAGDCSTCSGYLFNYNESSTYATDDVSMSLAYGSAKVSGVAGYDDFYLDNAGAFGITDFEFMLISK